MNKYDVDGKCIKCGYGGMKDEHIEEFVPSENGTLMGCKHSPERIARTCKHCGFWWNEAPLNRKVEYKRCWPTKDEIEQLRKTCLETPSQIEEWGPEKANKTEPGRFPFKDDEIYASAEKDKAKQEPEIRVGDTVSNIHGDMEFKVTWMSSQNTGMAMMAYKTDQPIKIHQSMLKFISRGPEVHTFEGVNISEMSGNSFEVYSPGHKLGFPSLSQKFTMTLTKEDTP